MNGSRRRGTESAKVMQVIVTTSVIGSGTKDDLVRTITEYWDFEGRRLARIDGQKQSATDQSA